MAGFLRVAACHASPVFLNARATTDKAIQFIKHAASHSAKLVVFPETYISAFPIWSAIRPPTENHALFRQMVQQSIHADGEEMNAIREAARATETLISIGFSERSRHSNACLYNSNLIVGTSGEVLVHHRKLVATFFEKLTWSPGDGYGLRVAATRFGRIGALICGENTNPLARYTLMAQAEQVHISTWPAIWPTRAIQQIMNGKMSDNAGAAGEPPNYDNVAANRTRAAAHCFEAKCFGVACAGHLAEDAVDAISRDASQLDKVEALVLSMPRAMTFFLDPAGAPLSSFTFDQRTGEKLSTGYLQNEEGILYADMDLDECIEGKQYHDVVGGYQRPDIFNLKVDRTRRQPISFEPTQIPESGTKEATSDLRPIDTHPVMGKST